MHWVPAPSHGLVPASAVGPGPPQTPGRAPARLSSMMNLRCDSDHDSGATAFRAGPPPTGRRPRTKAVGPCLDGSGPGGPARAALRSGQGWIPIENRDSYHDSGAGHESRRAGPRASHAGEPKSHWQARLATEPPSQGRSDLEGRRTPTRSQWPVTASHRPQAWRRHAAVRAVATPRLGPTDIRKKT